MVKGALFSLSISVYVLVLAGCARPAPEIPSTSEMQAIATSSRYASAECNDVIYRLSELEAERQNLETVIDSHRQQNQVAGYFGALFIIPAIGAEHDIEEKARLDEIQSRQDELRAVAVQNNCLEVPSIRR